MISIIICHRNETYLSAITSNIERTIGVLYELIVIDNTNNDYTIFSAYNEGVSRAVFDICCFTHEDIEYYTKDWGKRVLRHFEDPKIGMIGLVGAKVATKAPGAWWYNLHNGLCAINLVEQRDVTAIPSQEPDHYYLNPFGDVAKTEVVIADGLWFCIRRALFDNISFDELNLPGFHLYDADISLQVGQYAKIFVVYDIIVRHFSQGTTHKDYYANLLAFTNKWKSILPKYSADVHESNAQRISWYSLRRILIDMAESGFSNEECKAVRDEYLPILKKGPDTIWERMYFILLGIVGQKVANALFERAERLRKMPDQRKLSKKPFKINSVQ